MNKIFTLIILFFIITYLWADNTSRDYPDFQKIIKSTNRGLIAQANNYKTFMEILEDSREMENYDVKYYEIKINLDFENQYITADNLIRFEICENNVSEIQLNFTDNLTINEIQQNGTILDFTHADNIIQVSLNGTYNSGEIVEIQIQYEGYPENRLEDGLKFESHSGVPIAFTMVSPRGARKWWPCKDTPADKPDSIEIWVTYPEEFISASNGVRFEQINNGNETVTDKWQESYPIATYLTSFAVTNYDVFSQTYEYNGQTMPIDHYVYPEIYNSCVNLFSITPDMIDFFSTVYGEYPFLSEKYGHAVCTNLGALAMEHQTCTSYQSSYISDPGAESTVAHELAHQWAGDCLTIGSWSHVWLKEGFARYSEALWAEHLYGTQGLHDFMNNLDTGSQLDPCLYRNPEGSASHIFNIVIYSKGAWTMHMLRGVIGDEDFFATVYQLMQDPEFKYGNFLTDDLRNKSEEISGMELDWFFDEWFYNEGRPGYKFATYSSEQEDSLKISLLSQGNLGDNFAMYIPLLLNGENKQVFADSNYSYHTISLQGNLDTLEWDAENWVLDYGYLEQIPELEEIEYYRGSILLVWNEFFDPQIAGFNIYRKEAGGEYIQINEEPISGLSYFDEDVVTGNEYFYKIAAVFQEEEIYVSKFSNEVSGSPIDFTLDEGILLVDETTQANPGFPTNTEIDSFYHFLCEGYQYTDWDVEETGLPPLTEMARYSSIIWHSDELFDTQFTENEYSLKSYLLAGGNMFISGWKHLQQPSLLYEQYLHISSPIYTSTGDFAGAFGLQDFPYLDIVEEKVPFPMWGDNLAYIYKLSPENGAEPIFAFNSNSNDPDWENKTCAIRYSGDYKLYLLGFPLYYMNLDGAAGLMTIILEDFGEEYSITSHNFAKTDISLKIYPNPCNEICNIFCFIPNSTRGTINLYNIKGQFEKKLFEGVLQKGKNSFSFDTSDLIPAAGTGIYFIKLSTFAKSKITKIIIFR